MAKHFQQQTLDENELIKIRREKLQGFVDKGVEPFGGRFEVTHHTADVRSEFGDIEGETDAGEVTIAGRLMAIRGTAKQVSRLSATEAARFKFILNWTLSAKKNIPSSNFWTSAT